MSCESSALRRSGLPCASVNPARASRLQFVRPGRRVAELAWLAAASVRFEIMKTQYLILLAVALLGCSSTPPRVIPLTAEQAGALAQKLANERAQTLFNCQPF